MKLSDKVHWGSYAMLVRESAFKSKEIGNHDYLDIPEIIEDICICFEAKYKIDLRNRFKRNTTSAIVKFTSNKVKENYLGVALYYLYKKLYNQKLSINSNTCFDNKGVIINKKKIYLLKD